MELHEISSADMNAFLASDEYKESASMVEQTFIVCVKVARQDADLLPKIPGIIRARFAGTAVRVIECEPERDNVDPGLPDPQE